jgi:ribonuclease J
LDFNDVYTFITHSYDKDHIRYKLFNKYGEKRIEKERIINEKFIMCVRISMLDYLKSLNKEMTFKDGLLIYSLQNGYKIIPEMREFITTCKKMDLKVVNLHTSGHANKRAIKKLIRTVTPDIIMPIHTKKAAWFNRFNINIQ